MWRALFFCLKVAVVIAVAWWVAEKQPGQVSLDWLGYRIDTSVGVLLLAAFIFAAVVAVIYRSWGSLRRVPRDISHKLKANREKRGYRALTQGMVAVAAGEAGEAQRWARKADELLDEPPLTMLLSAQAAQLNGDDQAAKRYFTAMLERDETRFLGLRGLITQALHEGDDRAALGYAHSAYALRPRTPWVLETLFDLSERLGELEGAERAAREAERSKALPAPEARRRHAVILLERARDPRPNPSRTAKLAAQAHKAAPELVPATVLHAEMLIGSGRHAKAAKMLEKSWAAAPHPDLVTVYRKAQPGKSGIEWLTRLGKLVAGAPRHTESLLALAEAALEAKLWGEARRYLREASEADLTERICRLMARLEEAEHGDAAKMREWLMKLGEAAPDPAWVCRACGAVAAEWSPRCGACDQFDGLAWHVPPRVAAGHLVAPGEAVAAEPEPEAPTDAAPAEPAKPAEVAVTAEPVEVIEAEPPIPKPPSDAEAQPNAGSQAEPETQAKQAAPDEPPPQPAPPRAAAS